MRGRVMAGLLAVLLAGCGGPGPKATEGRDAGPAKTFPAFADHDPHDWPGRGPRAFAVHGIDVSRFQTDIDWPTARAAGVSFAFIKATEGGDRLDPMFETHWKAAGRAGVRRGAYHFYYFCRPAEEQAEWFIENVPRDRSALPPVLDMEWNPHSPTCVLRPDGAIVRAEAERFLSILERHYGNRPIVYTTIDFFRETGIGRLPRTQFWLRSVAGLPEERYPGMNWTFWQYTGTGIVPGVSGGVDINVFAGSAEAWKRWPGVSSGAQAAPSSTR